MFVVDDQAFEKIVADAIDSIPPKYAEHIKNLAFVVEDVPTPDQRSKLKLDTHQTLFGLYEGVPITKRSSGYNLVLPDKITLFKRPIELVSNSMNDVVEKVKHTVWHEVAHYYGLDHGMIDDLERGKK